VGELGILYTKGENIRLFGAIRGSNQQSGETHFHVVISSIFSKPLRKTRKDVRPKSPTEIAQI
jgi:hypothetical protein